MTETLLLAPGMDATACRLRSVVGYDVNEHSYLDDVGDGFTLPANLRGAASRIATVHVTSRPRGFSLSDTPPLLSFLLHLSLVATMTSLRSLSVVGFQQKDVTSYKIPSRLVTSLEVSLCYHIMPLKRIDFFSSNLPRPLMTSSICHPVTTHAISTTITTHVMVS